MIVFECVTLVGTARPKQNRPRNAALVKMKIDGDQVVEFRTTEDVVDRLKEHCKEVEVHVR